MGIFDSALKEKDKRGSQFGGNWGIPDLAKKEEETNPTETVKSFSMPKITLSNFDSALKAPSTEDMTQKQDILLKFEDDFQLLDDGITEDYKLYQEYSKQLDDLEIRLQEDPKEFQWKLTQEYNKIRDLHNALVDKLQADTAQQKKIFEEYNLVRESYDKDIEIYNKKATAQNKEYTKAVSNRKQTFKEPQLELDIPPEKPVEVPSSQFGISDLNKPEQMGKIQKGVIGAFGTWEAKKKANPELQKMEDFGSEILSEANKWAEELKGEDWKQSGSSPEQVAIIYERITGESKEEALTDIKSQKDLNIFFVNPPEKYKEAVNLHHQLEDIFLHKAEPGKDLIGQLGWSGMVAILGSQAVAGIMTASPIIKEKILNKEIKTKVSTEKAFKALQNISGRGGTSEQRGIFNTIIEQAKATGTSVSDVIRKGVTMTEVKPRFAFGTKLYAGLPADEIVKSIVEVGKVTSEAVKGLDPAKVSQVTQQLLNINPALASEFLKAVEKPKTIPKAKEEPTPKQEPKEPWQMTREDFVNDFTKRATEGLQEKVTAGEMDVFINNAETKSGDFHKEYISEAIKEGKPIPAEVLADYPELKTEPKEPAIPKAIEPKVEAPKAGVKPEPTKEDFEALKTTDKNKELFYEKYNNVYTETKKGYDRLIDERVAELKEEGFKGVEKGGLKKTEEGEVIGAYPTVSKNPKWYREFYTQNDRQPTNKELKEIAIKQLSEGYVGDYGEVSANKIFTTLNTQLETLDIVLSDIKEGNYSFGVSGNVLKLNKELDKLKKEIGKVKKEYEVKLAEQITESQNKFKQLSGELAKQKGVSVKKDIAKIKGLELERQKAGEAIEKLKAKLKEAKSKIIKPKKKSIKTLAREFTGQIDKKIEITENDILKLVLRGEAKAAKKAFSVGKKEGIFTQKEHFAEVVGRAKERKAKSEEIGKIKNILKKTNLKELRPERQKAIKAIIDEIDLKRMTEKTKRKLTSRLDFIKDNPDNQIPQEKIDELSRLNKKPIADFTAEDITLIKDSILHEINLNKLKNKIVFGKEIKEAVGELKIARANVLEGKDTIKDDSIIDSGESEHKSLWQRIRRIWGINSLNPEVICEELDNKDHGVIMKYIFNGLDKGITDKLGIIQEANAWFKEGIGDIDISKWSKAFQAKRKNIDFQEIKLSDGKTIKITKGERMSFLLHEKNEKNFAHLIEGGFRFSDNLARKYKITEENLDEIINSATTEEVKVADTLWKFFNEFIKPKLNEVSMELNGWEIAIEDNYFPIRTVALDRIRDALKARKTFDNKTLEGMGIFKERTHAKNALIIEDAFTAAFKHLEGTSSYIGLAKPLRYAKLILEDTEFQENVMKVKGFGKDYLNNLKRYIQEIEDDQLNYDNVDKLTVELINKLDSAILGMHIFVAFKQPVSYIGACTEIDSRFLAKATIKKNDYAEIRKHSPQLFQRLEGHITRELGELGNVGKVRQLFLNKSPLNSKILYLIKTFDSFTIGKIWSAVKIEIKEKYPDISQEEYFNKVTDRAEEVIRRTQPTWHTKDRSEIGRSKSIAIRLITKYTSQRNKNRIILKRATLNYNRSNHSAWDKITLMKKYSIVLIVNALLIGAIDEMRRKAYGRKSKSLWQYAIGAIGTALSNFYFVGDIFSSLASKIQKGTYAGYDTGNIVSSYIDTAIDGISEVGNAIEQLYGNERYKSGSRKGDLKWKTTALRALDRNASTLLALKGLPYNNVKNLVSGMWKMAGDKEEATVSKSYDVDKYSKYLSDTYNKVDKYSKYTKY